MRPWRVVGFILVFYLFSMDYEFDVWLAIGAVVVSILAAGVSAYAAYQAHRQ
jgi:hypothetical protein